MTRKRKLFVFLALSLPATLLILYGAVKLISWQKGPLSPLTRPDESQQLSEILAQSGLAPDAPLTISADTIVASISGITVYFSHDKDPTQQVRALQLLITRLKIEEKPPKEIDLRFNKAVVKY